MDKDYIAHLIHTKGTKYLEKAFQKVCEEKINDAIVAFQQGVTDYFLGEYSEERCTDDEHYEGGVNFGDFLATARQLQVLQNKSQGMKEPLNEQ